MTLPSEAVRNAYDRLGANLKTLAALGYLNAQTFDDLPADDFYLQRTADLTDPVTLFLEDYYDAPVESLHVALPVSIPGRKAVLVPYAAAVGLMLFLLRCERVGIAIVGSDGHGVLFRHTSDNHVVARGIIEESPARDVA